MALRRQAREVEGLEQKWAVRRQPLPQQTAGLFLRSKTSPFFHEHSRTARNGRLSLLWNAAFPALNTQLRSQETEASRRGLEQALGEAQNQGSREVVEQREAAAAAAKVTAAAPHAKAQALLVSKNGLPFLPALPIEGLCLRRKASARFLCSEKQRPSPQAAAEGAAAAEVEHLQQVWINKYGLQTWTVLQCDGTIHLGLWLNQVAEAEAAHAGRVAELEAATAAAVSAPSFVRAANAGCFPACWP